MEGDGDEGDDGILLMHEGGRGQEVGGRGNDEVDKG